MIDCVNIFDGGLEPSGKSRLKHAGTRAQNARNNRGTILNSCLALCAAALFGYVGTAAADTTDSKWQKQVVLEKQGVHCVDDPQCFNRYHPDIPAVARAKPGDMIVYHTRDALDSDLTLGSNADDVTAVDLNLVHPMTGPVHIEGAKRGDVIAITLVDILPDEYGYNTVIPSSFPDSAFCAISTPSPT
jgi:formamidase